MMKLSLSWNEIRERERNVAHIRCENRSNYKKRDEYVKVRKKRGPTVRWEQIGHATVHAPKQRIVTQKESGKL